MEFEEMLQGVTDEALRANLKTEFQKVNQVKGEYGNKLKLKDNELDTLKADKQTYSKAHDALKKSGIEADQIPKLLEKLGYQKTMEEEYEVTKAVLAETKRSTAEVLNENNRLKAEKAMTKLFDGERIALKDDKGQPVKLAEKFINYNKLYDVNDFTNETVLKEKCKQVLTEAFADQTQVLREVGHVGVQTHTTPDGQQHTTPVLPDLAKIMKEQGAPAAIQAMREAAAARK